MEVMAQIVGTLGSDILNGTAADEQLLGLSGNDVLRGSGGSDTLDGGDGFDSADYSGLGRAITLFRGGTVDKGSLGSDRLDRIERVVGAVGQRNSINGFFGVGGSSFNVNLESNSLQVNNVPVLGAISLTVVNFLDVTGTPEADNITGNSATNFLAGIGGNDVMSGGGGNDALDGGEGNDFLYGGAGNDTVVGGNGVDYLTGTDLFARGIGEIDTLTGGNDADGFILGDRNGAYYNARGANDYALIQDFAPSDIFLLAPSQTYQIRRDAQGFDIFTVNGSTRDLIADVRTTATINNLPTVNFQVVAGQTSFGIFLGAA
jgi:Ca2+-binding RTX toxin-like protein